MSNAEELLARANKAINEFFGLGKQRRGHGPLPDLFLFTVSWRDFDGFNKSKLFKHKKQAYDFLAKMKAEHYGQAGIIKSRYDCRFIFEEGIEQMWKEYDIQDWSLEEFRNYVEYHKNF